MTEISKELEKKVLQALEIAKNTGKIRKGTNEATKAIERGDAKLVIIAQDVEPKEIIMHLPVLCNEKKCACVYVSSKQDIGRSMGINVPSASACIVEEGDAKKLVDEIVAELNKSKKE